MLLTFIPSKVLTPNWNSLFRCWIITNNNSLAKDEIIVRVPSWPDSYYIVNKKAIFIIETDFDVDSHLAHPKLKEHLDKWNIEYKDKIDLIITKYLGKGKYLKKEEVLFIELHDKTLINYEV